MKAIQCQFVVGILLISVLFCPTFMYSQMAAATDFDGILHHYGSLLQPYATPSTSESTAMGSTDATADDDAPPQKTKRELQSSILYGERFFAHLFGGIYSTAFGLSGLSVGIQMFFPDENDPVDLVFAMLTTIASTGLLLVPGIGMIAQCFRLNIQGSKGEIKADEKFPFLVYETVGLLAYGGAIVGVGLSVIGFGAKIMNATDTAEYKFGGGTTIFLGSLTVLASSIFLVHGFRLLVERIELKRRIQLLAHTQFVITPTLDGFTGGLIVRF